jgi:hypothetical protein
MKNIVERDVHFGLCGDWADYYGATVYFESGWFIYGSFFGFDGYIGRKI